jgi:hypothetical protein
VDLDAGSAVDQGGIQRGSVSGTVVQELDDHEDHNRFGISDPESDGQARLCLCLHGSYLTNHAISLKQAQVAPNTYRYMVFSC